MMTRFTQTICAAAILAGCMSSLGCDTSDPGFPERQPLYRTEIEGAPSSGERGNMMISEVHWAGSVTDGGEHDPKDIFIEIQNKHPRPINVSRWHLIIESPEGERGYRIPDMQQPLQPNEYLVIATRDDGAFAEAADVYIEELELPLPYFEIELRGADRELMGGVGSDDQRPFAGGYDGQTVRSMERIQLLFSNNGGQSSSWHAYSGLRRADGTVDHVGLETVSAGYRQRTLASPGESNSTDYSGSTSSGGFE